MTDLSADALPAPQGPGWSRIEIRDLRAVGTHGVLPEERERPQPFVLDLDVWLDTRPAAASDDLADTVDYGALAVRAAAVITGSSYRLLEALAGAVAADVLAADERVVLVSVTVRKVRPPVPIDVGSIGVRAVLGRGTSSRQR